MSKLSGKVVIVTGASKGIGAGTARAFGAEGASVVVNYASSREGAEAVVADIVRQGGKAIAVQADVSKAADVHRLFNESTRAFGTLDVLVNNAGVFKFDPVESITEDEFHREFNINVLGAILTTQEAIKHFGADGGSIINIGSVVSRSHAPYRSLYACTKHAVDGLTKNLAQELGPRKIRVNSINPGPVDTEGARDIGVIGTDVETSMVAATPLGRMGRTEDIANVALFLASPESGWMTGELLHVSGGL